MSKNKYVHPGEVTRRGFLKASAAASGAAAVAGSITLPFAVNAQPAPDAAGAQSDEKIKYSACLVNCGSRCPLKVHVKDGVIVKVASETTFDDAKFGEHHIRPCLRGRSIRWKTYNPDRVKYPMLRTGKRGEGKFKRISWDEATTLLAEKLKYTVEKYGNEAIYYQYGSGSTGANLQGRNACKRLLNLYGGFLEQHGTYSTAQINHIFPYVYGGAPESLLSEIKNSDLVVMFGHNLGETRMSGGGQFYETLNALKQSNARVIIIDPRRTDSVTTLDAEWIPIRPGTDGALVAGIGYTLIQEGLADEAFLKEYCIGWDETTLPASAPKNASYKDYLLGNGPDGVAKTPEWASGITGISAVRIKQLAREIATAKAAWISQGWGLQRTANGEQASRAVMMVPIMTGQIGRPGTNTGGWGGNVKYSVPGFSIPNPVKTVIPCFMWTDAIARPTEMTAKNAHVKGKDRLEVGIKFLWNYAGNVPMNQHSDLNKTHKILQDESLCEFILVWENHMTATAKYADLLLPDVTYVESNDLIDNSYASGAYHYFTRMQNTIEPLWECRQSYDVLAEVAEKLGIRDKFTEGRTHEQWIEYCYNKMREKNPSLPTFAETNDRGVIDRALADSSKFIALKDFRDDPQANPLKTPSGKIEIYSERLAEIAATWELPEGDRIPAVPEYCETYEGVSDKEKQKTYPLQMTGFHDKGHAHSTYYSVAMLREAVPHMAWINPIDAEARGLKHGDMVEIFNDRGRIRIAAKVTQRVLPGVVAVPQGAWRDVNEQGLDVGGCINTLTTQRPSPLAKGNPQHTNLVEVKLA
ncbi:dimethyl sulfoxide reductase subunit A [Leminorella grimontii]|uniref:Dimethyl sulfoxide reductase subunit A n=1 Tax=Leminorella grimontii TaxID=82981 RepID=A0AAV5N485_9GAMM|nr:DMSO/selenate family reductase complex A subunit [Leminorella grimontii]KFC94957.1 anaerobic dimethyl sulfoxide reductase chain A [Leminorella grimontii ATCC 33999 = DSM 5078]GKX56923.1 dimethyl sulfoxide reductase subunit A [Leminorella grimontii]VFS61165.1 Dimethyl sulfoxide reductase DmsA precursor [Leminorella grimontii]